MISTANKDSNEQLVKDKFNNLKLGFMVPKKISLSSETRAGLIK